MTTQTQPEQINASALSVVLIGRAIGYLEGDTAALKEGQRELREWLIRLFYAVLVVVVVVALLVALIAVFRR
jgi:hypothetical protein